MNKIPSVFLRNFDNMREMTREVNPLCQWVLEGEGVATRKYDGSCVRWDGAQWWQRREVKKNKTPPPNWVPVETDDVTGKRMGWEPFTPQGYGHPLLDALDATEWAKQVYSGEQSDLALFQDIIYSKSEFMKTGTYELCGPKVNGNPDKLERHALIKHSDAEVIGVGSPRWHTEYQTIKTTILTLHEGLGWEGVVWHRPDGRMAKMKASDYNTEKE